MTKFEINHINLHFYLFRGNETQDEKEIRLDKDRLLHQKSR